MKDIEHIPHFEGALTVGILGGGTAGKTAAGYIDAVEAGLVPGVAHADVFVGVATCDDGSATGRLRTLYNTPATGDIRRSISALSINQDAAQDFENRFSLASTADDVRTTAEQLMATLSYSKPAADGVDTARIIDMTVELSRNIISRDPNGLMGIALGHLVLTALTLESDLDQASQTAGDLMMTRAAVIPVSSIPHYLKLRDGDKIVIGEHMIDTDYTLEHPEDFDITACSGPEGTDMIIPTTPRLLDRLRTADQVAIGPGSFLTSTRAALLGAGTSEALREISLADDRELFLLANIKLDDETKDWTVAKFAHEHTKAIGGPLDAVICNNDIEDLRSPVVFDEHDLTTSGELYKVISLPLRKLSHTPKIAGDPLAHRRSDVEHDMNAVAIAMGEERMKKQSVADSQYTRAAS
ncbi:MAG TPA: 2-phospho-L-lactate transferase CofD family protein [Candidatus Saccharimonadales bacterium]|jgi:2-phospho-L-lactate transferase/gluconeogenesis factor (CofD/UPF0052 family)